MPHSPTDLATIIEQHTLWLADPDTGARADLRYADLRYADLHSADLRYADLHSADLRYADLRYADLHSADLHSADLHSADLRYANLHSADLPAPTQVLLAGWEGLSDELTCDLMRYDAACHPDPAAFDVWVEEGACPYDDVHVQRAANFRENAALWSPGPCPAPYQLMIRCFAEKGVILTDG